MVQAELSDYDQFIAAAIVVHICIAARLCSKYIALLRPSLHSLSSLFHISSWFGESILHLVCFLQSTTCNPRIRLNVSPIHLQSTISAYNPRIFHPSHTRINSNNHTSHQHPTFIPYQSRRKNAATPDIHFQVHPGVGQYDGSQGSLRNGKLFDFVVAHYLVLGV